MHIKQWFLSAALIPAILMGREAPIDDREEWVKETLSKMTFEEKIGQLFIIPLSIKTPKHLQRAQELIARNHIGGVILKTSTLEDHVAVLNKVRSSSKLPLICVQDGENGLGFRYTDVIKYPFNLTTGAIQDEKLVYQLGRQIGKQCALAGININFSPVVDVNSNPDNLIIFKRSFGGSVQNVTRKASYLMRGMQEEGIHVCLKHFPGHGNTQADSHFEMPVLFTSIGTMEKEALVPFKELMKQGANSIMTAHIAFPELEDSKTPATISSKLIRNLVRDKYHFDGLMITDALNMRALTNYIDPGEIAVRAFNAGNDILLYGDHVIENIDDILETQVPQALFALKLAYLEGSLDEKQLDEAVLRILKVKASFKDQKEMDFAAIIDEINSKEAQDLRRELFRNAVTLVRDPSHVLTSEKFEDAKLYLVDNTDQYQLETTLSAKYAIKKASANDTTWINEVSEKDFVVIEVKDLGRSSKDSFGLSGSFLGLIESLKDKNIPHLITVLDHPYVERVFPKESGVLVGYENTPEALEAIADVFNGILVPKGKLPI